MADGCGTGDLGHFDEDGFLVVTGRAKALLIAKDGEKYSPEEVEEVMVNNTEILNQLLVYNEHKEITHCFGDATGRSREKNDEGRKAPYARCGTRSGYRDPSWL